MPAVMTNGEVLASKKISTDGIEHLDLPMPVLSGVPQRQGDVLVLPCKRRGNPGKLIADAGVTVVRGERATGANTHILYTLDGDCWWEPAPGGELVQGWLTVGDGSTAVLIHTQEHSVLGLGAGCYEIRRQREMAGEWRRVSD